MSRQQARAPLPPPSPTPPAPKGLPGFLRRTMRNPQQQQRQNDNSKTNNILPSSPPPVSFTHSEKSSSADQNESKNLSLTSSNESPRRWRRSNSNSSNSNKRGVETNASENGTATTTAEQEQQQELEAANNSNNSKNNKIVSFPADVTSVSRDRGSKNMNRSNSDVSTGSGADTDQQRQDQSELTYKETIFERTIMKSVVNIRDLRKLGWNGVPAKYRSDSWKILLGYLPANASRRTATLTRKRAEYADAIRQHYDIPNESRTLQEQETLRQVLVDVPRTAPEVGLFRQERVRRCMERLLYIWAMRHPASSYVQGINDLVTPLFAVFLSGYFDGMDVTNGDIMTRKVGESEEQYVRSHHQDDEYVQPESNDYLVSEEILTQIEADCYWCLTKLLAGIQDHYTCDQPGVQRMVARLEELVMRIDIDLCSHLQNTGIEFMQFAFKWMNCLLLREFKLGCVIRLWDTYFSEGDGGFEDFHVYVCAAFLCQFSNEVQSMDFDDLFGFMQNMPTEDWGDKEVEVLLSQAFVLSTLFGGSDAHLTRATSNVG